MNPTSPVPPACAIAFKEWSGVCHALGTGEQILILRKGGIAEVAGEFQPDHETFWLYPTFLHEHAQGLKGTGVQKVTPEPTGVEIEYLVRVQWLARVTDLGCLKAIEAEHVWTSETVAKRFHYRNDGIWLLCARVYQAPLPVRLEVLPEYEGCHTWVPLATELSTHGIRPVLNDDVFHDRSQQLRQILISEDHRRALA